MSVKNSLILTSLCFSILACSSNPKTHFYQLKALDTVNIIQHKKQSETVTILVNPIKFPEYLDQPQMVVRTSDYKFHLSENHHWAEPLKNEFLRVFMQNINHRISPNHAAIYSDLHGTQPNIQLSIEVIQFDVNSNNQVVLLTKLSFWKENKTKNITWLTKEFNVPVINKSQESKVEAQSLAIALFSDFVAEVLAQ